MIREWKPTDATDEILNESVEEMDKLIQEMKVSTETINKINEGVKKNFFPLNVNVVKDTGENRVSKKKTLTAKQPHR